MTRKGEGDSFQENGFSGRCDARAHRGRGPSIAPSIDSIFLQPFREAIAGIGEKILKGRERGATPRGRTEGPLSSLRDIDILSAEIEFLSHSKIRSGDLYDTGCNQILLNERHNIPWHGGKRVG